MISRATNTLPKVDLLDDASDETGPVRPAQHPHLKVVEVPKDEAPVEVARAKTAGYGRGKIQNQGGLTPYRSHLRVTAWYKGKLTEQEKQAVSQSDSREMRRYNFGQFVPK
jgi:hypothetical protein